MNTVLEDENLLFLVLQCNAYERHSLRMRKEELVKKGEKFEDSSAIRALEFDMVNTYKERIDMMQVAKAVNAHWCRVCRKALTDPDWHEKDDECTLENMMIPSKSKPIRLPMRCILHPSLSPYCELQTGFTKGPKKAEKLVLGTLHDLCVVPDKQHNNNGECVRLIVEHMDLEMDGMEGRFDCVWTPLGSMFHVKRSDMSYKDKNDISMFLKRVTKTDIDFIELGNELQGRYFMSVGTLLELLNDGAIERSDGSPCIFIH